MKVSDGRGDHRLVLKNKNTEKVRKFFTDNHGATKKQCSDATGLVYGTIRRAIRDIELEEKNDE